jgi:formylglycine-generating enzyme required for sulfatase activity
MADFHPFGEIPEMVALAGGEFEMGQSDGREEERPVHPVRVGPFGIGRHQVTNAQYDVFHGATGRPAARFRHVEGFGNPCQPVVGVNWFDAVSYCQWLTKQMGRVFRLPSEAEWEWAARGGLAGKLYPWGDQAVEERAGYHDRWRSGPEPVGQSEPNGFGLYDMCENVHEWCSDWYDPHYYAISPWEDPSGPPAGSRRASRGGAWRHHIKISRCAARSSIPPEFEYADYGFRVACGS